MGDHDIIVLQENEDIEYKEWCLCFSTDYDKENPLTKIKGITRVKNILLEDILENHPEKEEEIKQIKEEIRIIRSTTFQDSMTEYLLYNQARAA